ncbi:MAG: hypothetical protein FH758_02460 [Firmicutes bacterium]|nr:hypothetical protein [Bacillota bacterium]
MNKGSLNSYKLMIADTFETTSQAIGIHVMLLVVERALWDTKHKYEEAHLIEFSEEGISLDGLDTLDPEKAQDIAHHFVMSIISTLGRLVGKQLANQLTEQLKIKES